jgi:hypothetical protein
MLLACRWPTCMPAACWLSACGCCMHQPLLLQRDCGQCLPLSAPPLPGDRCLCLHWPAISVVSFITRRQLCVVTHAVLHQEVRNIMLDQEGPVPACFVASHALCCWCKWVQIMSLYSTHTISTIVGCNLRLLGMLHMGCTCVCHEARLCPRTYT